MTAYLLDTDRIIDFLDDRRDAVRLISGLRSSGLAAGTITCAEIYGGLVRSPQREEATTQLEHFLAGLEILTVDIPTARIFGERRAELRRRGLLIDNFDLLIASTALRFGLTLVTRNVRDFERIDGLQLYSA